MNCIVLSQSLASYVNFKEVLQKWRAEIPIFHPKYSEFPYFKYSLGNSLNTVWRRP